jgi:hypothetical protein
VKKDTGKRRQQPGASGSNGKNHATLSKIDVRIEGIQYIGGNQVFPNSFNRPKSIRKSTSMDFKIPTA